MFNLIINIFAISFVILMSLITILLSFSFINELLIIRTRNKTNYENSKRLILEQLAFGKDISISNGDLVNGNRERNEKAIKYINKVTKLLLKAHSKGEISTQVLEEKLKEIADNDVKKILHPELFKDNVSENEKKEEK